MAAWEKWSSNETGCAHGGPLDDARCLRVAALLLIGRLRLVAVDAVRMVSRHAGMDRALVHAISQHVVNRAVGPVDRQLGEVGSAQTGQLGVQVGEQPGLFTTSHQAYWDAARRARGDTKGTRALITILLAHRSMPAAALIAAMDRAITSGCLDPETVLIDARRDTTPLAPVAAIGALARYDRPPPSLTDYDDLLTGSQS